MINNLVGPEFNMIRPFCPHAPLIILHLFFSFLGHVLKPYHLFLFHIKIFHVSEVIKEKNYESIFNKKRKEKKNKNPSDRDLEYFQCEHAKDQRNLSLGVLIFATVCL